MAIREQIYTFHNWWGGPLEGLADYKGKPHIYLRMFDENIDEYGDMYHLTPITEEDFHIIMEGYDIFKRWKIALVAGTVDRDSFPCFPEEKERYDEIERLTTHLFDNNRHSTLQVKGEVHNPRVKNEVHQQSDTLSLEEWAGFFPLEMEWED